MVTTWCAMSTTQVSPTLLVSDFQPISGNIMCQCGTGDAKEMWGFILEMRVESFDDYMLCYAIKAIS
jgi:hypothetical protein